MTDTTDKTSTDPRPPLRLIIEWLIVVCVALELADTLKDWFGSRLAGRPSPILHTLVIQVPYFGAWVLLAPIIALLIWRFPPAGSRWKANLVLHAAAAVLVGAVHLMLASALFEWRDGEVHAAAVYAGFVDFFYRFMMFDVIQYLGMAGVVAAWTYYRSMRHREREAVRLAVRSSELERAMSEARLEALRRQLHPHFLFNSLNTIAGLARRGEVERVTSMIERLGDLLRLRLDDTQPDQITLDRELEWMDNYVAIERERFGSRLDVHTSVPQESRRALVPAMLLQPLVENAVRHGIASADERGRVAVLVRREGDRLVITVVDSGPGFGPTASPDGIGLSNTRARLAQLYGERASLTVGNGAEGGGVVTVELPWRVEAPAGTNVTTPMTNRS